MGAYGLDLGTFSPFLYAFREREIILDLFEEVCGARLTYSYLTIGGATHDLPEQITIPPGLAALTGRRSRTPMLSWTDAVPDVPRLARAAHRGIPHAADAQPDLHQADRGHRRAAARNGDRATAAPVRCCAAAASITTCAATATPIYTRMYRGLRLRHSGRPVRGRAARSRARRQLVPLLRPHAAKSSKSIRLVRQGLDRYPTAEGTYRVPYKMSTKLPKDECYLETECPRGQMGFYIVGDGKAEPLRARAKSSCFCNLSVTGPLCGRLPARRHPRHRRLARHRDGRDRPVIVSPPLSLSPPHRVFC